MFLFVVNQRAGPSGTNSAFLDVQEDEAPDRTPPVYPLLRPFTAVPAVHPLLLPDNGEVRLSIKSIIGP